MIKTIMMDMDDVRADFLGFVAKELKVEKSTLTYEICRGVIHEWIEANLFYNLDPLPDNDKLLSFMRIMERKGKQVYHLTNVGYDNYQDPYKGRHCQLAMSQKISWNQKFGGEEFVPLFTLSGDQKAIYANPETVLIDDSYKNCQKFREAGGKAIHYTNYDLMIEQFMEIDHGIKIVNHSYAVMP